METFDDGKQSTWSKVDFCGEKVVEYVVKSIRAVRMTIVVAHHGGFCLFFRYWSKNNRQQASCFFGCRRSWTELLHLTSFKGAVEPALAVSHLLSIHNI